MGKLFESWTSGSGGDSFKEKVYARQSNAGRRPITIAHIEPSSQVNLKHMSCVRKRNVSLRHFFYTHKTYA